MLELRIVAGVVCIVIILLCVGDIVRGAREARRRPLRHPTINWRYMQCRDRRGQR